jgi:ISXO2-like transposase domain
MIPPLLEIIQPITDEEACIEFSIEHGLVYGQPCCARCRKSTYRHGRMWRCTSHHCGWSKSIFKDSVFGNTRLPPQVALLIGYLWLTKCSHTSMQLITGCSSATVTHFAGLFRQLMANEVEEDEGQIGGENVIVEIDESKFGKRKYHRGHHVEGAWVIGGVERAVERRVFAEIVEKRDAATLVDVVRRRVAPGSIVHSDLWKAYKAIPSAAHLEHRTVNHSRHFVDPDTGVHTNTIEGTWHGMKVGIPERVRHSGKVENHISEFIWRRQNESDIWSAFLNCLAQSAVV